MTSYLKVESNDKRIIYVDYLKGFSIFTIVLMHLLSRMSSIPAVVKTLSAIGGTGVHVFFLCSGIGLYISYLYKKIGFVEFIKKRFLKVYVPYIIVVMISFFLPWMYTGDDKGIALLSHIFLFKMFIPQYEQSFGSQFWFISTIFQLYILFIPMCWVKDKLKDNKLFILLFTGLSVTWWFLCYLLDIAHIKIFGGFCFQYIWEFALGFILAEAFYKGKCYRLKNYLLLILAIVGITLQAGMSLISDTLSVFNDVPALIGYTSLALLLSNIPLIKTICIKLSTFSYEFFLIHMLIFITIFYFIKPQGLLVECVWGCISMTVALTLAFGYSSLIKRISKWCKEHFG